MLKLKATGVDSTVAALGPPTVCGTATEKAPPARPTHLSHPGRPDVRKGRLHHDSGHGLRKQGSEWARGSRADRTREAFLWTDGRAVRRTHPEGTSTACRDSDKSLPGRAARGWAGMLCWKYTEPGAESVAQPQWHRTRAKDSKGLEVLSSLAHGTC